MKRKIKECILIMAVVFTFCSAPKALAWWNLIYPAEVSEAASEKGGSMNQRERKVRIFILEWLGSLK